MAADASRKREDDLFSEPCAICVAPFRDEKQVILSCGHVFHRECLLSWEAFSQTQNGSRSCPCCRHRDYQKRTFTEGSRMYRTRCAVLIQRHVRGLLARRGTERAWMAINPGKRMNQAAPSYLSLPFLGVWRRGGVVAVAVLWVLQSRPPPPAESLADTRKLTHWARSCATGKSFCERRLHRLTSQLTTQLAVHARAPRQPA